MKAVFRPGVALALAFGSLGAQAETAQQPVPQSNPDLAKSVQPAQVPACNNACIRASAERAVQACAPRIEAEAPGDYEWLLRPYGSIFQEADSPEQPTSPVVRYRGDSVRFLNPQKEWVRAVYECGYDTAKQEVAYLKVRLGVLGKASAVPALATPSAQARAPQSSQGQPSTGQAQAAGPAQPAAPTSDRRRVGEMDEVSVLQIRPSSKPR